MRSKPFTILLAAPSPLYAPLYLAKQGMLDRAFRNVEFAYAPLDFSETALLAGVTNTAHENADALLGVGDPFHLWHYFKDHQECDDNVSPPRIVGGLLDRVCYWLVDGEPKPDLTAAAAANKLAVLTHPKNMTGYAVAAWYLHSEAQVEQKIITSFIFPLAQPGFEHRSYEYWKSLKQTKGCVSAYMTTDLFKVAEASREQHVSIWNSIHSEDRIKFKEEFENTSMSVMFTSDEKLRVHHSEIDGICAGVRRAIEEISDNPDLAAAYLREYQDSAINFAKYEYLHLANTLALLQRCSAYSEDLKVEKCELEKNIKLRQWANADLDVNNITAKLDTLISVSARRRTDAGTRRVAGSGTDHCEEIIAILDKDIESENQNKNKQLEKKLEESKEIIRNLLYRIYGNSQGFFPSLRWTKWGAPCYWRVLALSCGLFSWFHFDHYGSNATSSWSILSVAAAPVGLIILVLADGARAINRDKSFNIWASAFSALVLWFLAYTSWGVIFRGSDPFSAPRLEFVGIVFLAWLAHISEMRAWHDLRNMWTRLEALEHRCRNRCLLKSEAKKRLIHVTSNT